MDFLQAVQGRAQQGYLPVIPDIKCISPKEGDLMRGRDAAQVARQLADAGAPVLSVVTEGEHFGGSISLLSRVVEATGKPVLRKDFIRQPEQVRETARAGAKAVLLIVSMLEQTRLEALVETAREANLMPLVEIHNAQEAARIGSLGLSLVGINNRDILALEKDDGTVDTTESLIRLIPGAPFIVSESSIENETDVRRAREAGAGAVLVGTALLQAGDIAEAYRRLSVRTEHGAG